MAIEKNMFKFCPWTNAERQGALEGLLPQRGLRMSHFTVAVSGCSSYNSHVNILQSEMVVVCRLLGK